MSIRTLYKSALILLIVVLSVVILVYAKPFLVPITIASLLSMLLLPIHKWLLVKGIPKLLATILPILLLIVFSGAVVGLMAWQIADLSADSKSFEQKLTQKYGELQDFVSKKLGISKKNKSK